MLAAEVQPPIWGRRMTPQKQAKHPKHAKLLIVVGVLMGSPRVRRFDLRVQRCAEVRQVMTGDVIIRSHLNPVGL